MYLTALCHKVYEHVYLNGGTHGIMVITIGNGHGNPSSNPETDCLHFT